MLVFLYSVNVNHIFHVLIKSSGCYSVIFSLDTHCTVYCIQNLQNLHQTYKYHMITKIQHKHGIYNYLMDGFLFIYEE